MSCAGPGAGYNNPDESLPTQHILWFNDKILRLFSHSLRKEGGMMEDGIYISVIEPQCVPLVT